MKKFILSFLLSLLILASTIALVVSNPIYHSFGDFYSIDRTFHENLWVTVEAPDEVSLNETYNIKISVLPSPDKKIYINFIDATFYNPYQEEVIIKEKEVSESFTKTLTLKPTYEGEARCEIFFSYVVDKGTILERTFSGFLGLSLTQVRDRTYGELKRDYITLNYSYIHLKNSYNALNNSYNELSKSYSYMLNSYNELLNDYNGLKVKFSILLLVAILFFVLAVYFYIRRKGN
jgi:hypothetical protein